MSFQVIELADTIKKSGRRSSHELPPLLQQAEKFGGDQSLPPLSRGLAWRAAGNALQLMNRFQSAVDSYDRAVVLLEEAADPEAAEELGRTLHAKVGLLIFLSRFDEALECSVRARLLFERLGDRHRLARLDVNLSHLYHRRDQYPMVLEYSERALLVLKEVNDREGWMAASLNAAVALTVMHRFEEAEDRYRQALVLANELGLATPARQCRYNIAYLEYLGGNAAGALARIVALRSEFEAAAECRHVCLCWLDEAEILLEIGDIHGALAAAACAGETAVKLELNFEAGKAALFQAAARLRLDQRIEARQLLSESIRCFGNEQSSVWTALSRMQVALFEDEQGDLASLNEAEAARSLLKDSGLPHRLALAEIVVGRIERKRGKLDRSIEAFRAALAFSEFGHSGWMEFHSAYELGVSLVSQDPLQSVLMLQRAERMLDSLWDRLGSDELKLAFLHDRENVYTHLIPQTMASSIEGGFELSEKSRSRVLRERLSSTGLSLPQIQSRLQSGEMLLEYFIAGNDLTIFAVSAGTFRCIQRPGVVAGIQDHCRDLERHIASCSVKWERLAAAHDQLHATAEHHLRRLFQELIEPVEAVLPHRVIIVPHGFLHGVPFHAVSDGSECLIVRHEIVYSPSAALYCSPRVPASDGPPLFVAFTRDGQASSSAEVESAAGHFRDAMILINPDVAQLRDVFRTPRTLVHIAGHVGIDSIGGTISWIETPQGRLSGGDLTAMAVQAKTIVITGCQSARRAIRPGDEWQGLMRAFYLSGASTIVSAFWDIRDESARQFSSEFYSHFDGTNAPEAVRAASISIRNSHRHPYFWAGFGVFLRSER